MFRQWLAILFIASFAACGDDELVGLTPKVQADPSPVQLGSTPVGTSKKHPLSIKSVGSAPLEVAKVTYVPGPGMEISPDLGLTIPNELPKTLAVGQKLDIEVVHAPHDDVADEGFVRIESNDPETPVLDVPIVHGIVGAPMIAAVPSIETADAEASTAGGVRTTLAVLDLGLVSYGTAKSGQFHAINLGESSRPLVVRGVRLLRASPGLQVVALPDVSVSPAFLPVLGPASQAAATRSVRVTATWTPSSRGQVLDDVIAIDSSDPSKPTLEIPIRASTDAIDPPRLRIEPTTLDFGDVAVGAMSRKSVTFFNDGQGDLHLGAPALAAGSDGYQIIGAPAAVTVPSGGSAMVEIEFSPAAAQAYSGSLQVSHDDPSRATPATVALTGRGDIREMCTVAPDPEEPANETCAGAKLRDSIALSFGASGSRTITDDMFEIEGDIDFNRYQVSVDAGCVLTGYEFTATLTTTDDAEVCLHIGTCGALERTACAAAGTQARIYVPALGSDVCDRFNNDVPLIVELRHKTGALSCTPYSVQVNMR